MRCFRNIFEDFKPETYTEKHCTQKHCHLILVKRKYGQTHDVFVLPKEIYNGSF